jgi:hypothetical protein
MATGREPTCYIAGKPADSGQLGRKVQAATSVENPAFADIEIEELPDRPGRKIAMFRSSSFVGTMTETGTFASSDDGGIGILQSVANLRPLETFADQCTAPRAPGARAIDVAQRGENRGGEGPGLGRRHPARVGISHFVPQIDLIRDHARDPQRPGWSPP